MTGNHSFIDNDGISSWRREPGLLLDLTDRCNDDEHI